MALDLDDYFTRTAWTGERRPIVETLRTIHRVHLYGIPFENLDPLLGTAPSLDLDDLQAKLVRGTRGGYCYEHNTLLAAVLESLGFGVTLLCARVLVGAQPGAVRPRTHMMLLVEIPGHEGRYLADVGFGSSGALTEPVPLVADQEFDADGRRHRLVFDAERRGPLPTWVLQHGRPDGSWADQYAFTLEPYEAPDFEVINWHIGTNPRSPFTKEVYACRTLPGRHLQLSGRKLVETRTGGEREERELADVDEVLRVLEAEFGIVLPEGTKLP
ncbi:arylamine N-acetyltransferase family protein [Kitasatospora sp. NPDC001175]|uniref:arylamine N-acetyltransferase family protein n=1 Tax=Kitasatospora sp. NPDC001175 TaxID=3157103 RepID=UPI003D0319EF